MRLTDDVIVANTLRGNETVTVVVGVCEKRNRIVFVLDPAEDLDTVNG